MCRKIFVEKLHQQHGSRLNLKMTGDLPYIRGAGPYETLRRSDGKKRFLILPKMQINKGLWLFSLHIVLVNKVVNTALNFKYSCCFT